MSAIASFDPFLRSTLRESGKVEDYEVGPTFWSEAASAWIVTKFEDCTTVLNSPDFTAYNLKKAFAKIEERGSQRFPHVRHFLEASLIFNDSADHGSLRRLLARTLNSQPLSTITPAMLSIARKLWQAGVAQGRLDVVREFAEPLPSLVIAQLLGLDETQRQSFFDCTFGLMMLYNRGCPVSRYRHFEHLLTELRATMDGLFRDRVNRSQNDGTTRFLEEAKRLGLSDDQTAANFTFLYLASVDQTSALIGSSVRTLLQSQDVLADLRDKKLSMSSMVEELLRLESPAPQAIRVAMQETRVGEAMIGAGDTVVVLLSVGNRDGALFAEPDQLATDRGRMRHLAFSEGVHACVGAAFARVEAIAALQAMLETPPTKGADAKTIEWWPFDATRRMRSYSVSFS